MDNFTADHIKHLATLHPNAYPLLGTLGKRLNKQYFFVWQSSKKERTITTVLIAGPDET